jgi:hypothetical protein
MSNVIRDLILQGSVFSLPHHNILKNSVLTLGKLHSEELHKFYSSPSVIRLVKSMRMGRACSTNGGDEECI